jgi:hypothetical protein
LNRNDHRLRLVLVRRGDIIHSGVAAFSSSVMMSDSSHKSVIPSTPVHRDCS